ncbi:gag-pol polyprotein [Trichonephila clavata]|uniref:Gag-pol polyprotein n=1 Tax=Trichonephila clavata TaxID=2740835 RepID=A0A8X6KMI1_TRICU|nr:gag-pol polyprotein [Trichonephila clavata]
MVAEIGYKYFIDSKLFKYLKKTPSSVVPYFVVHQFKKSIRKEFKYLMAQGIIRPSKSPWASPLHVVKKSNGEYRPCGDYRRLNSVTVSDSYPVTHIQDCTRNLYRKLYSLLWIWPERIIK